MLICYWSVVNEKTRIEQPPNFFIGLSDFLSSFKMNIEKEKEKLVIHRAGINQTTFRLLITGPEDVIPVLATHIRKCIVDEHKVTDLKIHYAVSLNEELALKFRSDGLHAVVLCTDSSKLMTKSIITETLKYLDCDIVSTSLIIVNLIHPLPAIIPTVADAVKKLSTSYNLHTINMLFQDEESVKFGSYRASTAALRGSKFIYGCVPKLFNIDFSELDNSAI